MVIETKMYNTETKVVPNVTNGAGPESSANTEFVTTSSIFVLLIVTTNTFIFYVFFRNKRCLMRTPSTRLILSLSISHYLTGFALLGHVITASLFYNPTIKEIKYRIMMDIFFAFCVKAFLLHLCGIALDRFISTFYPLHYKAVVTVKKLTACISFTWGITFTASAIQLI